MATAAATPSWKADDLARALGSGNLSDHERRELLQLVFANKREAKPLVEAIGAEALREVYFHDRPHRPNPGPQTNLLFHPADDILYGGARGGGKSFGFLLHFLEHGLTWGHAARGVIFRRRFVDLEDIIAESHKIFGNYGGKFFAGGGRPSWTLPNGAELRFRYIEREGQAIHYQGHAYTVIYVEEAGTYSSPAAIDLLRGCLRSAVGVPCQLLLNANPGGVGHNWLKGRYVDPVDPGTEFEVRDDYGGMYRRVFIPSTIKDNEPLIQNDPEYINRLYASGPKWLVDAWVYGNWNIIAGGMFDDVLTPDGMMNVVVPKFEIPKNWKIYRALDWGSSAPFSVGWWVVANNEEVTMADGTTRIFPSRSIIRVAEWYGWAGDTDNPNTGCRMLARDVARGIQQTERELFGDRRVYPGPADAQIYVADGVARSIADEMRDPDGNGTMGGVSFRPSDKRPGSRIAGWDAMRRALAASASRDHEKPGMYVVNTCRQWIRTVPSLPRDPQRGDDVDTNAEDHIADECRYFLTSPRDTVSEEERRF